MDRSGVFETVIGFVVLVVAAVFVVYSYNAADRQIGGDQITLSAKFGRVDGVAIGSEVRIAGIKVGSVIANELDVTTFEADLKLAIASDIPVPVDSIAKIASDGLLGGAHISIEPGASEDALLDGERIAFTQGAVDLIAVALEAFTSGAAAAGGQ